MERITALDTLRRRVADWKGSGDVVALVPTMGNLHHGHLRLVEEAAALADRVIVSVFVNPTQFGPDEDFAAYPRTLEADRRALARMPVDILFTPGAETVYPEGTAQGTRVQVPALEGMLCALARPGHFSGVATVVAKLFNMVGPDLATFGRKDYQQLLVVRHMVRDLCMRVRIVGVETVRDADGLALSSRNGYLSPEQRRVAPRLNAVLREIAGELAAGRRDFAALEERAQGELRDVGMDPDYVSIRRPEDLQRPMSGDCDFVVLGAARLGPTRLIDNVAVEQGTDTCRT